jgi:hypothetical protein
MLPIDKLGSLVRAQYAHSLPSSISERTTGVKLCGGMLQFGDGTPRA